MLEGSARGLAATPCRTFGSRMRPLDSSRLDARPARGRGHARAASRWPSRAGLPSRRAACSTCARCRSRCRSLAFAILAALTGAERPRARWQGVGAGARDGRGGPRPRRRAARTRGPARVRGDTGRGSARTHAARGDRPDRSRPAGLQPAAARGRRVGRRAARAAVRPLSAVARGPWPRAGDARRPPGARGRGRSAARGRRDRARSRPDAARRPVRADGTGSAPPLRLDAAGRPERDGAGATSRAAARGVEVVARRRARPGGVAARRRAGLARAVGSAARAPVAVAGDGSRAGPRRRSATRPCSSS